MKLYQWLLITASIVVGSWILIESWGALLEIAVNYNNGRPSQLYIDQVILYGVPGLALGLLISVLLQLSVLGIQRVFKRISVAIWADIAANFVVVLMLARY
jgi:hypothetical protein